MQRFHPRRIRLIGHACVVLLLGSIVIIAAAAADSAAAAARQVPAVSKARALGALRILAAQVNLKPLIVQGDEAYRFLAPIHPCSLDS